MPWPALDTMGWFNLIEALFRGAFGVGLLVQAWRSGEHRQLALVAGVSLVLFGLSDLVEIRTGSWLRPWWLFGWKAVCLVTLVGTYVGYVRGR